MKLPQIEFRYSSIYDQLFRESLNDPTDTYPSQEEIASFLTKTQSLWQQYEKTILTTLSTSTQLKWKEEKIVVYVVGRTIAFSDPLTIPAYLGYEDYAIDVITHELIHRIFTQEGNYEKKQKFWDTVKNTYARYPEYVWLHIPVEAVHTKLYKELFDDTRLKRDKDFLSLIPEYKTAWDIVEKEGYESILKNFLEI